MPKSNNKYKCYLCDKEIRSDHLNRHYSTHINDMFSKTKKTHLQNCILVKKPIICLYKNKNELQVAYCIHCNKGSYNCVSGHTPSVFLSYHHVEECSAHFKEYIDLFKGHIDLKQYDKEEEEECNALLIQKLTMELEEAKNQLATVKVELDDALDSCNNLIHIKHLQKTWYKELNETYEAWLQKPKTTDRDNLILINATLDKLENFPLE